MARFMMKEPLIDSSLYPSPLQTAAAKKELFILLEQQHAYQSETENKAT